MDVGPLFIAHSQAAKLIEPSESSLYHPPPSAQSTTMFGIALSEQWHDVGGTQSSPDCVGVITTVA